MVILLWKPELCCSTLHKAFIPQDKGKNGYLYQNIPVGMPQIAVFRCSSRSSVSEDHLMGPSLSICLPASRFSYESRQPS
jgi:hypothetical protein